MQKKNQHLPLANELRSVDIDSLMLPMQFMASPDGLLISFVLFLLAGWKPMDSLFSSSLSLFLSSTHTKQIEGSLGL